MPSNSRPARLASLVLILVVALAPRASSSQSAKAEPQLAILDTDIGDDIDDSFALALLLQSPEVKLLGITTAFGDTELRARLVDRYLAAVHRADIPVYAGVVTPAKNPLTQAAYALQSPARNHGDGVDFLLRQIRDHPNAITLIAIGPFFNEEAAITSDPTTFRKLKRIVLMGGSVYRGYDASDGEISQTPSAEWNVVNDPKGAAAILHSGVPVFMLPLDSTQIHLAPAELARILATGSPLTDQLALLYHQWTGNVAWRTPTLFDPVAVTYAIRPELCPAQPMHLEVDGQGYTRPAEGAPNVQVCLQSDEKGFLRFLEDRILGTQGQ